MHHDPAAVLGRIGDATEVDLLAGRVVGLDDEVPQHRSQHDIHLGVRERGADAAPGSAAERHPGERRAAVSSTKRYGSKRSGSGKMSAILVQVGDAHHDRVAVRNLPLAEIEAAAPSTCRPAKSMTVRARCNSRIVACRNSLPPSSTSFDQFGEDVGVAAQPLERPAQRRRSGLVARRRAASAVRRRRPGATSSVRLRIGCAAAAPECRCARRDAGPPRPCRSR